MNPLSDDNGVGRMAIGAGGFMAALMFWVVSVIDPAQGWRLYWQWYALFPIIASATVIVMWHMPGLMVWWARNERERQQMLTEAHRLKQERTPKPQPAAEAKTINLRELAWRDWFIAKLEHGQTLGGIHFIGCMDAVMDYGLWRNVFWKVLFDAELANPIATSGKKERTTLKESLTPIGVATMLRMGILTLPYPDDIDPPGNSKG